MSWLTRLLGGSERAPRGADLTAEQFAERVRALPVTAFREGYDQEDVAAFAARVTAALGGTDALHGTDAALRPEDVLNQRFRSTKFRQGYDQDAVDDLLDEVVVALRARG
ncbi:DivIVA domain-containing protein [Cellulomonas sp. IC4_254]|nr:DivIVA domain-containing protein [Cellulomonas sp. IC4_254]